MSEFKIRTIRDKINEESTSIIGIDRFDDIDPEMVGDSGNEYYCSALVLDSCGNPLPCIELCFGKESSLGDRSGMDIHFDDEFKLPNPEMYRLLGEALKKKGYIYNKKKCRFQKVNS